MADVKVNVVLDKDAPEKIYGLPQVKGAVTKKASAIADMANQLGAGYRTPKWHDHETGETKGDTQPEYGYEKAASSTTYGSIAFVHPLNYAAMKDNYLHNTMLKAM